MSSAEERKGRTRRRMCVCTRVHQNNADRHIDLKKVKHFVSSALKYADSVAIAVGPTPTPSSEALVTIVSRAAHEARDAYKRDGDISDVAALSVFEVTPWGKFTPALNALMGFAARDGSKLVMFQSLETTIGEDAARLMEDHLESEDLVVGGALTGHAFRGGQTVQLDGVTTPWNTLALWDVRKLARIGFLGVAEGLIDGVAAGVEEVTAIATLQAILGAEHARAKLIRLPQVQWQTDWEDEGRRRWHESKMASKIDRAEKQMAALGVKSGLVHHMG